MKEKISPPVEEPVYEKVSIKTRIFNRSNLIPLLIVLLISACVLVTGISILVISNSTSIPTSNLCVSEQCIKTATRVLNAMNQTVDPCTDFYEYSCGRWIRDNPVPKWASYWDRLSVLRESLLDEIHDILEAPSTEDNKEPSAVKQARALYRSCMNTDKMEARGPDPLETALIQYGLDLEPPHDEDGKYDWIYAIAKAKRNLGLNILIGFSIAEDVRNSSVHKIVIEQVPPNFSEFLLNQDKFYSEMEVYKEYIFHMSMPYTTDEYARDFHIDLVDTSTEIAKLLTPPETRRSDQNLFYEIKLNELFNGPAGEDPTWKSFDWKRYLEIVFTNTNIILNSNEDTVILLDLGYLKRLAKFISTANRLSLKRYIWWNLYSSMTPYTVSKFRDLAFEMSKRMLGLKEIAPRWKTCAGIVNSNFGLALSHLYVSTYLRQNYREGAYDMLQHIKDGFEESVHGLEWMDDRTREEILTKLHAIRSFVGYPGWILNASRLNTYYQNVNVDEGRFFETFLDFTAKSIRNHLENLRYRADRNRWVASPTTVNAFYSASLNAVTFPAGLLKPPFYGNGYEALDYGSIGAIMGHEITHGFDDQGRRYDQYGNLKQWWRTETLKEYQKRVKCLIEQYNNYSMPEFGTSFFVHGYKTQGENIADNGGIRAAYNGYLKKRSKSNGLPLGLPGLAHMSPEQLFFIGFAQIWCGNSTLGSLKGKLVAGVHSPNKIRVIGTLRNSKDFSKAWGCPKNSFMNPSDKCILW